MKIMYFVIALLLGALVWMYFSKESGRDQEKKKLLLKHQHAMDSSHNVAEAWRKLALKYGDQYRAEATKAMQKEQQFNYLREENAALKRRPVIRYTDSGLDSLFRTRYTR